MWYSFLYYISRSTFFANLWDEFDNLRKMLLQHLDDIYIIVILWVIIWWRLGYVLFYDRQSFSSNLLSILKVNQWWMSYMWGVIWVIIWIIYLSRKFKFTWKEFVMLWELILLIVPLWSLLWRYWNSLNQELIWKPVTEIWVTAATVFKNTWLVRVYESIDTQLRVDTNILQSLLEWWLMLVIVWLLLYVFYIKRKTARIWYISWFYLICIWLVRFFVESYKDLPDSILFNISQMLSLWLVIIWISIFLMRRKI